MRVLVTGSSGFLGRVVTAALMHRGHTINQIDIRNGMDILEDENAASWFAGVGAVVHLAARPLAASVGYPIEDAKTTIIGTLRVLMCMAQARVKRIVFTSASSVYGPTYSGEVGEDLPLKPDVPYAVAKVCAERYLDYYGKEHGLSWTALRLFNVYGPEQTPDSGALIPVTLDRLSRGLPMRVTGSGSSWRDFVFAEDVAGLIVDCVEAVELPNAPMNVGTGVPTSVKRLVEIAGEALGIEPRIEYSPSPQGRADLGYYADVSMLKQWLGKAPSTTIAEGVRLCAAKYSARGGAA